jgi:ribose 1,5-bisphosphokinase PhnN
MPRRSLRTLLLVAVAALTVAAPAAASAPVRALAERLSAEGREALARIEAQLAALDRVELAKKSLEWHEAQADGRPNSQPSAD